MKQKLPVRNVQYNNYQVPPKPTFTQSIMEAGAANIILPLRLFLGISFLAAGFDKLFDPQFFDPNAGGYIGNQLTGFAGQSPLGAFLTNMAVPMATFIGAVVLVGELAIGLGTILGLFSRAAALFGFILSIILWLTASWEVTPFFLGSDLPYAIGWLTLFLAGIHPVLSLDAQLRNKGNAFETTSTPPAPILNRGQAEAARAGKGPNRQIPFPATPAPVSEEKVQLARRQFLKVAGATILAGAVTGAAWAHTLHTNSEGQSTQGSTLALPPTAASTPQPGSTPQPSSSGNNPPAATQPASNTVPAQASTTQAPAPTQASAPTAAPAIQGPVIGKLAAIPVGNVLAFKTPNGGESAYLVHEKDGSVKAFSRICTHEGCEVTFVQNSMAFLCPCHGAAFDAATGAVLRRPARQPLQSFGVQVDSAGNIIYTG